MLPEIIKTSDIDKNKTNIYLVAEISHLPESIFDKKEIEYIEKRLAGKNQNTVILNKLGHITAVCRPGLDEESTKDKHLEKLRKTGENLLNICRYIKIA